MHSRVSQFYCRGATCLPQWKPNRLWKGPDTVFLETPMDVPASCFLQVKWPGAKPTTPTRAARAVSMYLLRQGVYGSVHARVCVCACVRVCVCTPVHSIPLLAIWRGDVGNAERLYPTKLPSRKKCLHGSFLGPASAAGGCTLLFSSHFVCH